MQKILPKSPKQGLMDIWMIATATPWSIDRLMQLCMELPDLFENTTMRNLISTEGSGWETETIMDEIRTGTDLRSQMADLGILSERPTEQLAKLQEKYRAADER